MTTGKIKDDAEAWESGELGRDERFAAAADKSHEAALAEAMRLSHLSPKEQSEEALRELNRLSREMGEEP